MDEKELFELAKHIALFLGNRSRMCMTYDANGLVIVYTAGDEAVEVQYLGATVFKRRGSNLESYAPGGWESLLTAAKSVADRAQETQTQQTEAEGRDEGSEKSGKLREAWGLDSADSRTREGDEPRKPGPGGIMEKPAG